MSQTNKLQERSSKLQQSVNEVIQAIKDGKVSIREIVTEAMPGFIKPKITKEQRKQKKSEYYQEWYERNKDYHKIWREKRDIKKKMELNKANAPAKLENESNSESEDGEQPGSSPSE